MKNLTVIEAINELVKGVNKAYARNGSNAYTMQEIRDIYNAIEFLAETIQSQTAAAAAQNVASAPS